ncbi:retron system putative HNH endonuclease [Aquimarina hainanensis]|uniref:Retron system putative HNH endonuclease n=1 Tax=Aquimarina hainanensis TaxID=1578017 RepID=A0ABW5N3Y8_9FLAO
MKHIIKSSEPQEFKDWKSLENENWKPTYNDLQNPEKQKVYNSLLSEQGYICCYCERKLIKSDYHIEHFKPQEDNKFPELQLEYGNMLCSCQRNVGKGEPLHCGNSKGNWFDERLVSPLDDDCETKFKYTFDGHIIPADRKDKFVDITIQKLELNIDKLIDMRNKVIEPFLDPELTEKELSDFVTAYLVDKSNNGGKFNQFYTTIQYLFT